MKGEEEWNDNNNERIRIMIIYIIIIGDIINNKV